MIPTKKELSRHQLKTAGEPASIRLTLIQAPDGFKADGADMVLVEIEVVDKDGRRCPLANDLVTFDLKGPAEWRGGIAQGPDNYILSKELPVECGVNRVLIRSTNQNGAITLKAFTKGLPEASLSFRSILVKEENGLSEYITGEHQPGKLARKEITGGQSFQPSRQSITIVDAIAESNQNQVKNSFDDNERSEWANDGKLKTGWIIYELERDAEVSEIELKMSGWRRSSYPIQIFVDDKEVFKGETEKSLGYISIPITPTKGRYVKIQLIGLSSDKDAFGELIEVTGKIEPDAPKSASDSKGQLRIIEAEVYERIK